jgi:2'-5' RNA ligase
MHLIKESTKDIPDINIHFKGISTSAEAVMVQGFPLNDNLEYLRNRLRSNFKATTLQQSIDARYTLSTAHITTVRFREQLNDPEKYAELLENYRNVDFGHFKPEAIELVYNDWYQKVHIVETLYKANL